MVQSPRLNGAPVSTHLISMGLMRSDKPIAIANPTASPHYMSMTHSTIHTAKEFCDIMEISLDLQDFAKRLRRHDFPQAQALIEIANDIQQHLEDVSDDVTTEQITLEQERRSAI